MLFANLPSSYNGTGISISATGIDDTATANSRCQFSPAVNNRTDPLSMDFSGSLAGAECGELPTGPYTLTVPDRPPGLAFSLWSCYDISDPQDPSNTEAGNGNNYVLDLVVDYACVAQYNRAS